MRYLCLKHAALGALDQDGTSAVLPVGLLALLWKGLRLMRKSAKGRGLSCPVGVSYY